MKKFKLPKTDSIEKLAEFWDRHDLTEFEEELEEVKEPVYVRGSRGDSIEETSHGVGRPGMASTPPCEADKKVCPTDKA